MVSTSYSPEPPRRDLIFHQTFDVYDEVAERYVDTSPQSNDATVLSGDIDPVSGVVGQAARVDSGDSLVVNSVDQSKDYTELLFTTWFDSENVLDASVTNVQADATFDDGSTVTLSHSRGGKTFNYQFAALRYDGETLELWYTSEHTEDEPTMVDSADVSDKSYINGLYNIEWAASGFSELDDVRVYENSLTEDHITDIWSIGSEHQSVRAFGEGWDNDGIPYVGRNRRMGGALGEEIDYVRRQLDAIKEARHIQDAAGYQLDKIGEVAGIKRRSDEGDDTYRARIIGEVAAGRSSGTFDDVVEITAAIIATEPERISVEDGWERLTYPDAAGHTILYIPEGAYNELDISDTTLKDLVDELLFVGHRATIYLAPENGDIFTLKAAGDADDPAKGLTGPNTSTGGGLLGSAL